MFNALSLHSRQPSSKPCTLARASPDNAALLRRGRWCSGQGKVERTKNHAGRFELWRPLCHEHSAWRQHLLDHKLAGGLVANASHLVQVARAAQRHLWAENMGVRVCVYAGVCEHVYRQ